MTTFGEALAEAGKAALKEFKAVCNVDGLEEANRASDIAFLKALEASGFKIIGPEGTPAVYDAMRATNGQMNRVYAAVHAAAPSITDLLAEEQP